MKLVVALALSVNAFTPSTPGGAKTARKAIPTSSAAKADPTATRASPTRAHRIGVLTQARAARRSWPTAFSRPPRPRAARPWNADFHESMIPQAGDLVVEGKKGLDAFPGTNLESLLKENGIETLALSGFLTNCCVESSMRTAYEKGT